jgi:hypothetical protein
MNWIKLHLCTDCKSLIYHIGRNGLDQCDCEEE